MYCCPECAVKMKWNSDYEDDAEASYSSYICDPCGIEIIKAWKVELVK
jgi:hypothetical protein